MGYVKTAKKQIAECASFIKINLNLGSRNVKASMQQEEIPKAQKPKAGEKVRICIASNTNTILPFS